MIVFCFGAATATSDCALKASGKMGGVEDDIKLGWGKVKAFAQGRGAGGGGDGGRGAVNDQRRQSYSGDRQSYSVLS